MALSTTSPSRQALIGAALAYYNRGDVSSARRLLDEHLAAQPGDAQALHLRGLVAYREGDYESAVALYERVFPVKRADAAYLNHLGLALWRLGDHAAAERALRKAMGLQPGAGDAARNLAAMLVAGGRDAQAEPIARELAAAGGDRGEGHHLLAGILERQGRAAEAMQAFREAVHAGSPKSADALRRLAALLMRAHRLDEATEAFRELEAFAGEAAYACAGRGVVAMMRRDHAAAEHAFTAALRADAAHVDAIVGLASLRVEQGRGHEAEKLLRAALADAPDDARLHNALALRLLERGALAEGFREYEWRHRALSGLSATPVPDAGRAALSDLLRGGAEALAGRRVTVVGEQGLGDELFFLRYAPLLAARGAVVQVVAAAQIAPLVAASAHVDRVLGTAVRLGKRAPAVHAGDLPALLMTETDGVPVPPPFPLCPDAEGSERALARLASLPRPIAAVAWRAGDPARALQLGAVPAAREIAPAALGRALAGLARSAVVVQRAPADGEIAAFSAAFGGPVADLAELNEDLPGMCAILQHTEHCVGVSSTNMHLRASLGLPADVLVSWPGDWRWGDRGASSPWFPGFRLHRQGSSYGWDEALASLRSALAH